MAIDMRGKNLSLHKLPGKSNLNVRPVRPVRPVRLSCLLKFVNHSFSFCFILQFDLFQFSMCLDEECVGIAGSQNNHKYFFIS